MLQDPQGPRAVQQRANNRKRGVAQRLARTGRAKLGVGRPSAPPAPLSSSSPDQSGPDSSPLTSEPGSTSENDAAVEPNGLHDSELHETDSGQVLAAQPVCVWGAHASTAQRPKVLTLQHLRDCAWATARFASSVRGLNGLLDARWTHISTQGQLVRVSEHVNEQCVEARLQPHQEDAQQPHSTEFRHKRINRTSKANGAEGNGGGRVTGKRRGESSGAEREENMGGAWGWRAPPPRIPV